MENGWDDVGRSLEEKSSAGNEWVEVPQNKVGGGTARPLDLDGKPQCERDGHRPGDYPDGRTRNGGGQSNSSTVVESGWKEAVLTDIGGEMLEHYIWQSGTMNTPPEFCGTPSIGRSNPEKLDLEQRGTGANAGCVHCSARVYGQIGKSAGRCEKVWRNGENVMDWWMGG